MPTKSTAPAAAGRRNRRRQVFHTGYQPDRVDLRHRPAPHQDHPKITRGPGSRAAGLAMAFKLIQAAQDRWRAVNGPHLVALVRASATFVNGKLVERPDDHHLPEAA
jgi:hypothetical protein